MAEPNASDTRILQRRPWDVFERESYNRPPNELRYSGLTWLAALAAVLCVGVAVLLIPALEQQAEFREVVETAADSGFPQVPPSRLLGDARAEFVAEWNISCDQTVNGVPHCAYLTEFSGERLAYEEQYGTWFIGIAVGLFAILMVLAVAYSRALNNLYALGFEMSYIPPAWAFVGFLIPVLNIIIPWLVVSRVWSAAWTRNERRGALTMVSVLFGIIAAVTAVMNPWVIGWIVPRSDIGGWLTSLRWIGYASVWTLAAAAFATVLLNVVAWRQRARYRMLDAMARA